MAAYQRYQDLQVGDRFPPEPMDFVITPQTVAAFRSATRDMQNVDQAPGAAGEAPSMLAAVYLVDLLKARQSPPGGIHAKQSFRFHRVLRVGEHLKLQGRVVEKFVRKGRPYVVSEFEARDSQGAIVCSGTITSIWGQDA